MPPESQNQYIVIFSTCSPTLRFFIIIIGVFWRQDTVILFVPIVAVGSELLCEVESFHEGRSILPEVIKFGFKSSDGARPPSRRRISELVAEFLSAEYQPKKIRLAESAAEFLPP